MIKSKAWDWQKVSDSDSQWWREPSMESYYLINRWQGESKTSFLDLGCGIGRHSIMFAKSGFSTYAFDLSKEAVDSTKSWAEREGLSLHYNVGDMVSLPYENEKFDCIICYNVISHTDTEGVIKVIDEIKRVLKKEGECYLTLRSKESSVFKEAGPMVDENTKVLIEDGPENGVPHFYADYDLLKKLFGGFEKIFIKQSEDFYQLYDNARRVYHYHLLLKKE